MRRTEIWAVELLRIADFFQDQPDGTRWESGFVFSGCRITLTELEGHRFAGMRLPRIQITFEGEEGAVSAIYQRFLLRFLSAGG